MLDKVFSEIIDEIALEGEQGCTFDRLFTLFESLLSNELPATKLKKPLSFNDQYKSYLWNKVKDNKELIITKNGSVIDSGELSYEELNSKSNSIAVKTTEEAQDRVIYGNLKSEKKSLTDKHKLLINAIAKSRRQGITQYQLGEDSKMDTKTVFYYLKKLEQLGLIVKEVAYASKVSTNIIVLKRFADQEDTSSNKDITEAGFVFRKEEFKQNVISLLEKSKDNMMGVLDAIKTLGLITHKHERWARVRIMEMHNAGQVEKFTAHDGTREKQCIRLVSNAETSAVTEEPKEQHVDTNNSDNANTVYRDLPIEYVFYQDIVAAKEKGLLRQELLDKYPFIDPIQSKIFLDNVATPPTTSNYLKYQIYRTEEIGGKTRQYRYFSLDGWREYNKSLGKDFDEPMVQAAPQNTVNLVEPKSIDDVRLSLVGPDTTRKRKTYQTKATSKSAKTKKSKATQETESTTSSQSTTELAPNKDNQDPNSNNKRKVDAVEMQGTTSDITTPPPKASKKPKRTAIQTTKSGRIAIILDMLEKEHILIASPQLLREFHEIEKQLPNAAPNAKGIARATFDSMVNDLHSQKKLTKYVTTLGLSDIKTLLLHSSLNPSSEPVKEFIERYRVEQQLMTKSKKATKLLVVPLETLPSIPTEPTNKTPRPPGTTSSWRYTAIEYGWISSKWLRARELHEAMFEYSEKQGGNRELDMAHFLNTMPLKKLMTMFAVLPYDNSKLADFLQTKENRDISMNALPLEIKNIVVSVVPKIRWSMIRLIDVLKALGVVESTHTENVQVYQIEPKLMLSNVGNVRDYKIEEHPIREIIPLDTIDDVHYFWVQLQLCCTEYHESHSIKDDETNPLNKITKRRCWNTNTLLSPEQKSILDSFIDKEKQTVPDESDKNLRAHIAKKTNLSSARIKMYYKSMLVAFKKYETKKQKEKRRLENETSSSPAIQELMKASLENRKVKSALFKLKSVEPFSENTYVGSRKIRRLKVIVEPYQGQDRGRFRHKRVKDPFTDIEKDVLIHAYCIMKTRGEESNFLWSPISKVIPDHTAERCRRVLSTMLKYVPNLTSRIESLKAKWIKIYKRGIAKKELKDENPWDTVDYDLNGFLEYFLIKLQESDDPDQELYEVLPRNVNALHSRFGIIKNGTFDKTDDNSVHLLEQTEYNTLSKVPNFDEKEVQIELAKVLIKMVLMTPEDVYDSRSAFYMFKNFPENITKTAVHTLKEEGLIVQDKMRHGRVPGRHINVSEKFLDIASGALPYDLFNQAKQFYNRIVDDECPLANTTVNGGTVAAVLDLLSQGKIFLNFKGRAKYIALKQSLYYPKMPILQLIYMYKNLDLAIRKIGPLESIDRKEAITEKPIVLCNDDINKGLASMNEIVRLVYYSIRRFKEQGASWSDIREHVKEEGKGVTDKELCALLDQLLEAKPAPYVQLVGFKCLRYVAAEYMSAWLLKKQDSSDYVHPFMWYNASGEVILPALEGCANTVISHIIEQPGISFASLRDKLENFLTEYELHHILKYLQKTKKITLKIVKRNIRDKRSLLFSKRQSATTKHSGVNDHEITHYWALSSYYL